MLINKEMFTLLTSQGGKLNDITFIKLCFILRL